MKDDPDFARLCVYCLSSLIALSLVLEGSFQLLGLQTPTGMPAITGILVGALVALAGPRVAVNGNGKSHIGKEMERVP